VCDEAHRLKNKENQTTRALHSLPVVRRVLLTGTPMQNDLNEFYAMVDFTNPNILGTLEQFRRKILYPVLRGREPDATDAQKTKMLAIQNDLAAVVNEFILRRVNTLNAQHLPPKLVQVVCCQLTQIQQNMYQHLLSSKELQHVMDGKQQNCLQSIQMLMKLCNHPTLVVEDDPDSVRGGMKANTAARATASKTISYGEDEKEPTAAAPGAAELSKYLPYVPGEGYGGGFGAKRSGSSDSTPVHPEWSGKMFVLWSLMKEMRKPGNGNDKIVIVSNYTQTLDLIGRMCKQNHWGFCRLDGSVGGKKRQAMVDDFNNPSSSLIAFLLSSKAGGWYVNLLTGIQACIPLTSISLQIHTRLCSFLATAD
jgi:DNA repair and recombination protein RAD54 and RAD54-like protein